MTSALTREAEQAELICSTETPKTAREALYRITALLRTLSTPQSFNLSSPTTANNQADLHPLSTVCLPYVRRALYSSLEFLENAVQARDTWNRDSTQHLRRIRHDALTRHHATLDSRLALSISRNLAHTEDPFAPPYFLILNKLRHLAERLLAITNQEVSANATLLTICNATFLADFHFEHTPTPKPVVRAKLRLLPATEQEVSDDNVDAHLTQLVTQSRFDLLQRVFLHLMRTEKLSVFAELPLVDALRSFEDDLLNAASIERAPNPFTCHGHIVRTALGLRIQFATTHAAFLAMEHVLSKREISVARSAAVQNGTSHCTFVEGKKARVAAQYVLTLTTPIPAFLSVLHTLQRISVSNVQVSSKRPNLVRAPGVTSDLHSKTESDDALKAPWPLLSDLIVPNALGKRKPITANGTAPDYTSEVMSSPLLPNGDVLQFQQNGMSPALAMKISRVPLRTTNDVFPVLQLLRQQLVFNELFQSCVRIESSPPQPGKEGSTKPVEMVLEGSPDFMQLSYYDDSIDDVLSVVVHIASGGQISVVLKTANASPTFCSDPKATQILQTCRSIPLTLYALMTMSARGQMDKPAQ
ncbi:hypothetical protein BWQ96_06775 [Gracilariopsis chorda]|uniref:Uncharacterized protein n=1 Tax=Gracilariopsis chorda TaxID=448386 RepID=A0A2V3IN35_9FLOR|nr:hypothetical protein BWQ96_06775 [Gracilariopsis chorda]|eukprot:PXF43482.1 hypothetical protein BWQ96_06775 [Gracilariopsis chorda]